MKTRLPSHAGITTTTIVRSRHPVTVLHYAKAVRTADTSAPASSRLPDAGAPAASAPPRPFSATESGDADIVFRLYAREIGQVGLLSQKEEATLSRRVKRGNAAAREQMIKANLRLVVKIAHDFEGYGMPLLDLISEGNIGLMKAVERFNPAKGAKLSTYAAFYIKQAMRRAIADHARLIRLPVYAQEKLLEIYRAETRLRELLGRAPTNEEIGDEINLPAPKVSRLRTAAIQPTSLDAPQDDDPTNPISEVVADESALAPDECLNRDDTARFIQELLCKLPERELLIIRHRFGFEQDHEKTLEQIGADLGLTRERIRQIQNSALRKLRSRIEARESFRLAA
jgi:RNA polymerase primary sigma factor